MTAIVRLGPAYIGVGVDASDSMAGSEESVIQGVNEQARVLLETATDRTFLTAAKFADEVTPMFSGEIPRFRGINKETYRVHGGTALLDCLGYLLDQLEPEVEDPRHGVSPATGLAAIFTDGEENVSRVHGPEHSPAHRRLLERVRRLRATGRWTFVVMGPEDRLDDTCRLLGFPRGNARAFRQGAAGARQSFQDTSVSLTGYMDGRARGIGATEEFYGPAGALPPEED
jgi:hypothetical protein